MQCLVQNNTRNASKANVCCHVSPRFPLPSLAAVGLARRAVRRRQISSFRVEKPSEGLRKLLGAVHKQIRDEEREKMAAQAETSSESIGEVSMPTAINLLAHKKLP